MKIKGLIAIDLDGTLLPAGGRLSEESVRILSYLSDHDYMIVLATGRPLRSLMPYYDRLHCFGPVIAYNGSHCFDPNDPSFPSKLKKFPKGLVQRIFKDYRTSLGSFMAESDVTRYCSRRDTYLDPYFPPDGVNNLILSSETQFEEDLNTCVLLLPEEEKRQIREMLKATPEIGLRDWSASPYSELFFPAETKGKALEDIASYYGCKKEDIYAFGDADNDLSMLEIAGHPFAMKDCKSIRLASTFPSTKKGCSEDGVAYECSVLFNL